MNQTEIFLKLSSILVIIVITSCKQVNYDTLPSTGREPVIEPDYSAVMIPKNIAPMNFLILEEGNSFIIRVKSPGGSALTLKSSDGIVRFPVKSWKNLLTESRGGKIEIEIISKDKEKNLKKYDPFFINVSDSRSEEHHV